MAENTAAASQASPSPAGAHAGTTTTAATPVAPRASPATRQKILDVANYTVDQLIPGSIRRDVFDVTRLRLTT